MGEFTEGGFSWYQFCEWTSAFKHVGGFSRYQFCEWTSAFKYVGMFLLKPQYLTNNACKSYLTDFLDLPELINSELSLNFAEVTDEIFLKSIEK